jgi:hypothetical protein
LWVLKFYFKNDNFEVLNICGIIFQFFKWLFFGIYFVLMFPLLNISYYQMSISGRDNFCMLLKYIIRINNK